MDDEDKVDELDEDKIDELDEDNIDELDEGVDSDDVDETDEEDDEDTIDELDEVVDVGEDVDELEDEAEDVPDDDEGTPDVGELPGGAVEGAASLSVLLFGVLPFEADVLTSRDREAGPRDCSNATDNCTAVCDSISCIDAGIGKWTAHPIAAINGYEK